MKYVQACKCGRISLPKEIFEPFVSRIGVTQNDGSRSLRRVQHYRRKGGNPHSDLFLKRSLERDSGAPLKGRRNESVAEYHHVSEISEFAFERCDSLKKLCLIKTAASKLHHFVLHWGGMVLPVGRLPA
jgi:hypothetical protein